MTRVRTDSLRPPTPLGVAKPGARFAIRLLRKLIGALSLLAAGPGTLLLALLMLIMLRDWQGAGGGPPGRGTLPLIATFAGAFLVSIGLCAAGYVTLSARRTWVALSIGSWASWTAIVSFVGALYVWETYPATFDPTIFAFIGILGSPAILTIPRALVAGRLSRGVVD